MFSKIDSLIHKPEEHTASPEEQTIQKILRIVFLVSAVFCLSTLIIGLLENQWSAFLVSTSFAITCIVSALSISKTWESSNDLKLLAVVISVIAALVLSSGVFSFAYGIPLAISAIIIAFLFATYNQSGRFNEWIIGVGLFGALVGLLLGILSPFPQISNLVINIVIVAFALALIIIGIRLILRGSIVVSLRTKLIMISLMIAIVPLIVISVVNSINTANSIKEQSNETLRIATELTISQLDDFFSSRLTSLQTEASLPSILAYMKMDPASRAGSLEEADLITTLSSLQTKETTYTPGYGLLNLLGVNIYDTDSRYIGRSELITDYFRQVSSSGRAYVSSVEFVSNTREAYIYFVSPIFDENRSIIGYLRMRYDARILQTTLLESSGMIGTHSYPVLLDENGVRLADSSNPNLLYKSVLPISPENYLTLVKNGKLPSYLLYEEIASPVPEFSTFVYGKEGKPFQFFTVNAQTSLTGINDTATYAPMSTQPWNVVFLQEQTAVVAAQSSLVQTTGLLAVLIAGLISVLIAIASNAFTKPILQLTDSAVKIAGGDLNIQNKVTSKDEIGVLGNAFNTMTSQLKESIENLENRVQERTHQLAAQNETLQFRSRQLQTVADVARGIVSTTDFNTLLSSITTLISDRFNYYHVGIFLIDDLGEYAILRAANSIGGQRMLNRQHRLKVGQVGIVGFVTGTGQPRIATDVGKDAVFFNNPDLPETKSEMALPLKIEDKIIGALDIQSTVSNAFSEEDINLFTTLADQVSIAINNNRLLSDTERALNEAQSLHRQYLDQEWSRRAADIGSTSYRYTSKGLVPLEENLPEVKMVFDSGRPVTRTYSPENESEKPYSVLAVPVLLRGQTIGVIHLRENEEQDFVWSENELVTVQTVADQVAQTLESARLFEQTIRRADRERRVLEITSKIRSTNEPQKMLEVTLEELKRHLGVSQAQIVINVPGSTSGLKKDSQTEPFQKTKLEDDGGAS